MPRVRPDQYEERPPRRTAKRRPRPRPFLIEVNWHLPWGDLMKWQHCDRFAKREDRDAQLEKLRRTFPDTKYKVEFRPVDPEETP